jgi:hypothetical protein
MGNVASNRRMMMDCEMRGKLRNHVIYCKVLSQNFSGRNEECHEECKVSRPYLRSEVLKSMCINVTILWPLAGTYQHFGGTCCSRLEGRR